MFVASSGLLFNERFRRNKYLIAAAGVIALISTYLLTIEIVDQVVGERLAARGSVPTHESGALTPADTSGVVDSCAAAGQALEVTREDMSSARLRRLLASVPEQCVAERRLAQEQLLAREEEDRFEEALGNASINCAASDAPTLEDAGLTPGSREEFMVAVGNRVFFEAESYELGAHSIATLGRQMRWLRQHEGTRILLVGNDDERGSRLAAISRGERRAEVVQRCLIAFGVPRSRMDIASGGMERPLDRRSNEEAWSVNRSVQTQIVSGLVE